MGERNVAMADDGALPDPEPPAPTDERLPLNKRQVFKLQKSWKGIKRNMAATGLEMFVSMFRSTADTQTLFEKFRHIENEVDLRTSEVLEEHGSRVMEIIDDVITNIENVDYIMSKLHDVGSAHRMYAGFTSDFFWRIEVPFLKAVKLTLGDRYTDNMDTIYRIVIKLVLGELAVAAKGLPSNIPNGENADSGSTNRAQHNTNSTTSSNDTTNKLTANASTDKLDKQTKGTSKDVGDKKGNAKSS